MSSWYEKVSDYIQEHLDEFIEHFFPDAKPVRYATGIRINPSPCCQHRDCFSFGRYKNVANCFSCGTKGTRISYLEQVLGKDTARRELEKFSGIRFVQKEYTAEEKEQYHFENRVQEIVQKGIEYYHQQLLIHPKALEKQTGTSQASGQRSHTIESLQKFKVGLSYRVIDFYNEMREKGYTAEELKEAGKMFAIRDGYYVYPYYDTKGNVVRINTKLCWRSCQYKELPDGTLAPGSCSFSTWDLSKEAREQHEKATGHSMANDVFSSGEKTFYIPPKTSIIGKKAILVEGENDAISLWEELKNLPKEYARDYVPVAMGGRMNEEAFKDPTLRQFAAIYECFDNDPAGDEYRKELNSKIPDLPVYRVVYDADFKDIDSYIKSIIYEKGSLQNMLDNAQFIDCKEFLIEREDHAHIWVLKNRKFTIRFQIESFNPNQGQLEGTLLTYRGSELVDKKNGGLDRIKLEGALNAAKLALSQHLDEYYNHVQWYRDKPKRTFWELRDILFFTKEYNQVIKQLAWYLFNDSPEESQKKIAYLHSKINQKVVAEILKEVNGFQNDQVDPHTIFPRIQLSQFFSIANDDAYFYFSRIVKEGEVAKLVPCLLSNKKEEIRLDLLKRKDPQCLLLINNRYELPFEVPTAAMDQIEVSLQPIWVDRWKEDSIDHASLQPAALIQEIEDFIQKTYFTSAEIRKVLSLWIFSTYFYMLFKSGFPYLIFNGPKGSGKSTFDTIIYLLALNPKFALDMSESSLYRTISYEGGTFILDEVEDLTEKKTVNSSAYAKVLKGGYADLAYVYRMNMDKGVSERFSVFGPKVISNINGIEDVIGDRCIYVRTRQAPESELKKLIDPQIFKEERRTEAHSITSRCVISALMNFQKVNSLFQDVNSRLDTGNARLTQILRPLLAMATFVGGDYAEHLMNYYAKEIKTTKEEIAAYTLEGMIQNIFRRISEELVGIEHDRWATDPKRHVYEMEVSYNPSNGIFEVDTLFLKVLIEEINETSDYELKEINSSVRAILGGKFDFQSNRKQTTATVDDLGLQKRLGDKRHVRVYKYFLNISMFLDKERMFPQQTTKADESLF